MNSNRNLGLVKFAVLALMIAGFAPLALRAGDSGCSNSTLKGGYRGMGTRGNVNVITGVFNAQVNLFVAFGDGTGFSYGTMETSTSNGNHLGGWSTVPETLVTYTVNSDCTGTTDFGGAHFNIVADPNGAGFFFIRTDPGFVVSGEVIRISHDNSYPDLGCSLSTLNGSYRATGGGTVGLPSTPALEDVVNNLHLNGNGNGQVTAATFAVGGGIGGVPPGTIPVVYTVNSDCTGTATFGGVNHFNIVLSNDGSGFFYIQTDAGNVVSGRVIRLNKGD